MNQIPRLLTDVIRQQIQTSSKAVILYGARQVGKTTLANQILAGFPGKILRINADKTPYVDILSGRDSTRLAALINGYDLVFIEEEQRIPNIGINLKIMVDGFPDIRYLVTGSFSFELAKQVSEPLIGRVWSYTLYPIAFGELCHHLGEFTLRRQLENHLIYGGYPEVVTMPNNALRRDLLLEITRSYLYRDALELAAVKHSIKLRNLLKLLSFQVGSEVSTTELASHLGITHDAVER